ncbi:MAG: hypothetical protein L3J89_04560 [Gammaproteobacteria bacterium]|nr:hypothetical protein [Gammaproteobacteria bacterium]
MKIKKHLLISEETPWGVVDVWQEGSVRSLYIQDQTALQSQLDMARKEILLLQHCRAMMSFLLFQEQPQSILLLGLGGGSIIHFLRHWFPELKITAVDINEKIVNVGEKYFDVLETPQVSIEVADAFSYLLKSRKKNMNVILVDLHNGNCLPDFVFQYDFMDQCYQALSLDGVLVINILVSNDQGFIDIMTAVRKSFKNISIYIALENQKNILLFAFKSLRTLDIHQLYIKAVECQKIYGIEFEEFVNNLIKVDAQ